MQLLKLTLIACVLFFCYEAKGQSDSLAILLENASEDTTKFRLLLELSEKTFDNDSSASIHFTEQAEALAKKLGDDRRIVQSKLERSKRYYHLQRIQESIALFEECAETACFQGFRDECYTAHYYLGEIYYYASRFNLSLNSLHECEKINIEEADTLEWLNTLNSIAICYEEQGRYEESLVLSRKAYSIAEATNNTPDMARFLNSLGMTFRALGKNDSAYHAFENAFEMTKNFEDQFYPGVFLQNMGIIQSRKGDHVRAMELYYAAAERLELAGDEQGLSQIDFNLGLLYKKNGEHERALDMYRKSMQFDLNNADTMSLIFDHMNIGNLFLALNEMDSAKFHLTRSYRMAVSSEMECFDGEAGALGTYYYKQGDLDSAEFFLTKEYDSMVACDNLLHSPRTFNYLGQLHVDLGKLKEAENYLLNGYDIAKASNYNEDLKDISWELYELYKSVEKPKTALFYLEQFQQLRDTIFNQENTRKMAWREANFRIKQVEDSVTFAKKKEAEILEFTIANQKQRNGLMLLGFGIVLIGLISGVLFARKRKQLQHEKDISLEKDKGLKAVIDAQEAERMRISKDLHDGIGQQLSALKLAWSKLLTKVSPENKSELEKLSGVLSDSADEVRAISHQMMPKAFEELGLPAAIEDMLDKTFHYSNMTHRFDAFRMEERLDSSVEVSLYRICQELVNNCIKHSEATEVGVQLFQNKSGLTMIVEDNGKGMETPKGDGHGLVNIKTRLSVIEGTVSFQNGEEDGTIVTVRIPNQNRTNS